MDRECPVCSRSFLVINAEERNDYYGAARTCASRTLEEGAQTCAARTCASWTEEVQACAARTCASRTEPGEEL
eukprot:5694774-Amphidinium_carterae.1